jgi:hypothetical protein
LKLVLRLAGSTRRRIFGFAFRRIQPLIALGVLRRRDVSDTALVGMDGVDARTPYRSSSIFNLASSSTNAV